jgi:hypothetical protein
MKPPLPNPVRLSRLPEPNAASRRSEKRKDLLALGALALLATILFGDVLAGFGQFYMRDLTRYFYPSKQVLRQVVKDGEFPYWNRYISAGQPIAANPEYEVFYPLTWLILLSNFDLGYRLLILAHIYISLFGMYALLRSMELRWFASFVGAFTFGLGGVVLSLVNLLPMLFCVAWIPLICLYVRRFLLHRQIRDFALGSLFLGLQFLVGEPTTILQTGALLGCYALYRGWYSNPRLIKSITGVFWIALFCVSGLLVAAVQILPAIDHVHDSARSRPLDFAVVSAWSFPGVRLAELVYPNLLGHISIHGVTSYWGGSLYPMMGSPFLYSIYCGLLLVAVAIGGVFVRPRGGRFVLCVVIFSVLIAMGGHTPLFRFLYDHGIFTTIRYSEKFLLLGLFVLIVFGAQMFDRLLDGDRQVRDGAIGFALATSVIAVVVAGLSFTHFYQSVFTKIWGYQTGALISQTVGIVRADWIAGAARGVLLTALLAFAFISKRRVWMILATFFLIADLGPVANEINPRMPRRFFDPPPITGQFPPNRSDYRIFHEADWQGNDAIVRNSSTGQANYWVVRNGLFPEIQTGFGLSGVIERDYDMTALLPTVDLTSSVWDVRRSGRADWAEIFMAMSNAWFRGIYQPFAAENERTKEELENSLPVHFDEGPHWPRYYFSDQVVTIRDRADFVNKLSAGSYSRLVAFITGPSFPPARGVVYSAVEKANSATLDVESFGEGFLVMSVTPHKYWRIEVSDVDGGDSHPVPAVVTNIGYQGIVIPPGRHRVTMVYRNGLVPLGAIISAIAVLALGVLCLRRRMGHEPSGNVARKEAAANVEPIGD